MFYTSYQSAFDESGALIRGHFKLSSGLHSDVYVDKFRIMEDPMLFNQLCFGLANQVYSMDIDYVAGPVTLGVLVAQFVSGHLRAKCLCAERCEDGFVIGRQTIPHGAKVMVVDDVGTSGRSIALVCAAVEAAGATVVSKGVLVARTGCPEDILRVVDVEANTYEPDNLPEHLVNMPVVKPGTSQT